MPDDIFIPPPAIAQTKVRWHEVVCLNPMGVLPVMSASAQHVDLDAGGLPVGQARRAPQHDLTIQFDQNNPRHVQAFAILDEIVKEAHAAKMAEAGGHG